MTTRRLMLRFTGRIATAPRHHVRTRYLLPAVHVLPKAQRAVAVPNSPEHRGTPTKESLDVEG
jgi:hypothetical protein